MNKQVVARLAVSLELALDAEQGGGVDHGAGSQAESDVWGSMRTLHYVNLYLPSDGPL